MHPFQLPIYVVRLALLSPPVLVFLSAHLLVPLIKPIRVLVSREHPKVGAPHRCSTFHSVVVEVLLFHGGVLTENQMSTDSNVGRKCRDDWMNNEADEQASWIGV